MNLKDLLSGQVVLEEIDSPVNGKISVIKSLGLGTYIQVGKLTQSGGVVYGIWKSTINKLKNMLSDPQKILILGLGGGSCAKIAKKTWQYSQLTGVDFDKDIVELGNKYLNLGVTNTEIVVKDAYEYLDTSVKQKKEFNLIFVDLYVGQEYPVLFESDGFLENVVKGLTQNGIAVFNRLYFGEKRSQAMKFGEKLTKYFSKVEYYYPEANLMFICTR